MGIAQLRSGAMGPGGEAFVAERASVCSALSGYGEMHDECIGKVKLSAHRAGLPGNVDIITRSAFLSAYPAKAGHLADLPVELHTRRH
jgi:hypothetical protein